MPTTIVLEIQAKPECIDKLKEFLQNSVSETKTFDGYISVEFHENLDEKGSLLLFERWESRKHYEKYIAWRSDTGAMTELLAMTTAPPQIRYFEKLDF